MDQMLDLLLSKGVPMANIIPDRNWNIKDPAEKELKLRKLDEMVKACRKHGFPIIVGTEMNKLGLPFVDNFLTPELQPYIQDFMDGAHFLWGHTLLSRYADYGYFSAQVEDAYGKAKAAEEQVLHARGAVADPAAGQAGPTEGVGYGSRASLRLPARLDREDCFDEPVDRVDGCLDVHGKPQFAGCFGCNRADGNDLDICR